MSEPDPLHELERREGQLDAAEDHVQRHDGREVQKPSVVRLLKVVNGRGPDTDRRQEADRHSQHPSCALAHRWSSFLRPDGRITAEYCAETLLLFAQLLLQENRPAILIQEQ